MLGGGLIILLDRGLVDLNVLGLNDRDNLVKGLATSFINS
jgi:hypothetical protein